MKIFNNQENLEDLILKNNIIIIQYGTKTCSPCISLINRIDEYIKKNPDVKAYYVSIEENKELVSQKNILSSPTIEVYINQKLTIKESGYFSLDLILDKINKYKKLL